LSFLRLGGCNRRCVAGSRLVGSEVGRCTSFLGRGTTGVDTGISTSGGLLVGFASGLNSSSCVSFSCCLRWPCGDRDRSLRTGLSPLLCTSLRYNSPSNAYGCNWIGFRWRNSRLALSSAICCCRAVEGASPCPVLTFAISLCRAVEAGISTWSARRLGGMIISGGDSISEGGSERSSSPELSDKGAIPNSSNKFETFVGCFVSLAVAGRGGIFELPATCEGRATSSLS
jgi:hypothetical protein